MNTRVLANWQPSVLPQVNEYVWYLDLEREFRERLQSLGFTCSNVDVRDTEYDTAAAIRLGWHTDGQTEGTVTVVWSNQDPTQVLFRGSTWDCYLPVRGGDVILIDNSENVLHRTPPYLTSHKGRWFLRAWSVEPI